MLKDSFLDYLRFEQNYSEATVIGYRNDLTQFEEFLKMEDDNLDLADADSDLIRNWESQLMNVGYKPTSVNRKLSSLRSFYRFMLKRNEVGVNPAYKVRSPKGEKTLPVFLREEEMNRLLDETDYGDGYVASLSRMVVEMLYVTGMRRSELVGLKKSDIDFYSGLIKVTGKRNKQRVIPFGEELKKSMQEYGRVRDEAVPSVSDFFFLSKDGEQLNGGIVYNIVKKALSKVVKLKKRSPHVLRHTFATTMLNNNADLEAVKELLGHTSLSATEVYTHATFEELKRIYKQAHPRA